MPRFETAYRDLVAAGLERLNMSNREASARTRGVISHTLVREIRVHGYVPSAEAVVELALVLGEDPNVHLDAAGKPDYVRYVGKVPERERARVRRGPRIRSAALVLGMGY